MPAASESPSGQCVTPGPTDFCKTPAPPAPVPPPMPYPNIAMCSDAKGSSKVKSDNKPTLQKGAECRMSNGDNPGVAGGVKSGRNMAGVKLKDGSPKVKAEGKKVAHQGVPTEHNNGNFPMGAQATPCQTAVKVMPASDAGALNADAAVSGAAASAAVAPAPAEAPDAGKGKPCAVSKKPSAANQKKANKRKAGSTCPVCGRTLDQVVASLEARGKNPAGAKSWHAEHMVPASAVKKMKGFSDLEKNCPGHARDIMTRNYNIIPLCHSCNTSKGATPLNEWGGGRLTPQIDMVFRRKIVHAINLARSKIEAEIKGGCP